MDGWTFGSKDPFLENHADMEWNQGILSGTRRDDQESMLNGTIEREDERGSWVGEVGEGMAMFKREMEENRSEVGKEVFGGEEERRRGKEGRG